MSSSQRSARTTILHWTDSACSLVNVTPIKNVSEVTITIKATDMAAETTEAISPLNLFRIRQLKGRVRTPRWTVGKLKPAPSCIFLLNITSYEGVSSVELYELPLVSGVLVCVSERCMIAKRGARGLCVCSQSERTNFTPSQWSLSKFYVGDRVHNLNTLKAAEPLHCCFHLKSASHYCRLNTEVCKTKKSIMLIQECRQYGH